MLTSIIPDGKTATETFRGTDAGVASMRRWIDARQGRENIYFTVNAVFGEVESKPNKGAIFAIRAVHVDVDPRPGEPLDAERERALRLLRSYAPAPTVIVDSGGGFQGFWLSGEDVPVGGSAELARLFWRAADPGKRGVLTDAERAEVAAHEARLFDHVEARNLHVEAALQADACHNADRIMRLPGTVNVPNKKKRDKGRVPALAHVVDADWQRRYRLDSLPAARRASAGPAQKGTQPKEAPAPGVDLEGVPVSDLCKRVIVNGHDPDDPGRWGGALDPQGRWQGDRSKAVWWVACEMARAGCSDAVMLGILLDPDYAISAHVRDQKGAEGYARKQVQDAREEVDNNFDCDKEGNPYSNSQRNVRVALRRLGVALRHDLLAERALVEGLDGYGPNLDDDACNRLWLSIDERYKFRPTVDFFNRVLSDHARQRAFHPVLDYLAGLRWDGVPRIGRWLAEYGGAADTPYTRAVGELVLVAAVRRVRRPGVKFDEMLVLESPQGTNKSTALKVLAVRDEWFTDDVPLNAEAKRVIEALAGKWIVEAGELKGMRKGGADHLKGFLSRTHDKARMAYDRREREVPRQCVIVGTTNDSRYLRDTTGNRRFWPVAVEGFNLDALRRDRDQLWAEAAAREAEGVPIRLDPALWADAEAEQDARRVEEPFYERLHNALGEEGGGRVRAEDAWRIVGRLPGQRTQDDNERLGDAMRRLDFHRTKRRFGLPHPEWCYVRGDGNVPRLVPRFGLDGELEGVVATDGGPGEPF
ncbi:MAG: VapE domain-containing protein [Paracoccus sp. (in: a-proteobacteria)]|uniref:VapE domain-containing protein n=1 Tax=Paracoccus sp. TaxID=267 RepID=UPI00391CB5C4